MPAGDVQNGASKYNDFPDSAVAKARLQQEAQDMTRRPLTSTRGVRDITRDFVASSQRLSAGQLVKDEYFTLFEAVGALEIMDPKMDSGCIPAGDSFEPDFDVYKGLPAAEVLWIMDELLRLEMSFHDGYPLSQNLFTSLHVMRLIHPDNKMPYPFRFSNSLSGKQGSVEEHLTHVVLRAYCTAIIKSVHFSLEVIQSYTYYEEEDFVTYLFGRELLPKMGSHDAMQILAEAVDFVDSSDLPRDMKVALVERLALREDFLACLEEGDVEQWQRLLSDIEAVDKSHSLVKPVPAAFSTKVQRQLATSTPPRPMPDLSWQDACNRWSCLVRDIRAVFDLTAPQIRQSPHSLQRAIWAFSYRQPPPTTLARAKMQEVLTRNDSVADDVAHFDLMLSDIRDLVLAGDPLSDPASFQVEVPTDPRHRASRLIEDFMQRSFGEYLNLYRMVCQNRCRMRRTFTQAIPLLDEIETDAREADRQLNEIIIPRQAHNDQGDRLQLAPLTLWVRHHKLQIMQWTIQLGFETEVYLQREMADMYLTLREIAVAHNELYTHLLQFISDRYQFLGTTSARGQQEQSKASEQFVKSLALRTGITISIASALAEIYVFLESQGIIDIGLKLYEKHQLHYEARMKPFLGLTHDNLPGLEFYLDHKKSQCMDISVICSRVDHAIKQAKSDLAKLKMIGPGDAQYLGTEDAQKKDLKSMETVCVAISVSVSQLRGIIDKQSPKAGINQELKGLIEVTLPAPGSRYHDWWVVPQFKAR